MKADFLFAGLKWNRIIQKKQCQKKSTFYGWCFKTKGNYIFKCWDWVLVCSHPIKISGYAPGHFDVCLGRA